MSIVRDDEHLFNDGDLHASLQDRLEKLKQAVERYDGNRLLNTPVEDLVAYFQEEFRIQRVELRENEIAADQAETTVDVSRIRDGRFLYGPHAPRSVAATAFHFYVPFEGEGSLFKLRPNSFDSNPPSAVVRGQELVLTFSMVSPDPEAIKGEFQRELQHVQQYVRTSCGNVDSFNQSLTGIIRAAIDKRKERLLTAQNTAAAIGYPMRRREGAAQTYAAPAVRRRAAPAPPTASAGPFKPEPVMVTEEYEHILDVMQNMALVLERSPSAFKTMGEEDIRQHFLVQLNGHYEGGATGETFNVEGKTDILVRADGKNIFIAECKFWKGPSGFKDTIDQLLGYAAWRDTKTAIVVFNRNTAMSTVVSKVPEVMKNHPNFKREISVPGETRFRAVVHHKNDPSREMIMTVMVFDVPQ